MATASTSTAAPGGGGGRAASSSREGSAKAMAQLIKLPKNLLAKTSTIKNTGLVLEQMPRVISSLDAHMENGLQSVPHLKTVIQLLANIESCQLKSLSKAPLSQEEPKLGDQPSEAA
ncbi:hypothetical protein HYC85_001315 [Camellia sinensis]|uniref:Tobamovirus multiplication protein 2B n=1 Tax=Camellia sinensis TaxID=4442 RepID=A0A7J7I6I3_CAMSI|nr:hypothetical protein HYC85_001315 [Camellia sinensis]